MSLLQSLAENLGFLATSQTTTYPLVAEDVAGWMDHDELEFLRCVASAANSIVEIGSWKGRSTFALAQECDGTVYAVDIWKNKHILEEFKRNVGRFGNIVICQMDSQYAATQLPNVDVTFIDGGHDYLTVVGDIMAWKSKTRMVLCGHDYNQSGVRKAVLDTLRDVKQGPGKIWFTENLV